MFKSLIWIAAKHVYILGIQPTTTSLTHSQFWMHVQVIVH